MGQEESMGGTGAPVVGGLNTVPASGSYAALATGNTNQSVSFKMPNGAVSVTPVFAVANYLALPPAGTAEIAGVTWAKGDVAPGGGVFMSTETVQGKPFSWHQAISPANYGLGATGTDGSVCPPGWRMPTGRELFNLVNKFTNGEPESAWVNPAWGWTSGVADGVYTTTSYSASGFTIVSKSSGQSIFLSHGASNYWSSTSYSANTNNAWRLHYADSEQVGYIETLNKNNYQCVVRCVR